MQLQITESASVYRKTQTDTSNIVKEVSETPICFNNVKDMGKMVVMSGTARRNSVEKLSTATKENYTDVIKNLHHKSFLKLRRPFHKSRQKQIHPADKLMSKSCETLFEHFKPFKNIQIAKEKNPYKRELSKIVESSLKTTNIVYQTATRKVEIVSVFEENPTCGFNKNTSIFDFLPNECDFSFKVNHYSHQDKINVTTEINGQVEENFELVQRTVSSEDFVTNAFSEPRITFK